jgi:phage repressor protein C with HTH and peptisase S24 domain
MSDFSKNTVVQRFKAVYKYLENNGLIKGKSDLAKHLGTYNHVVNSILQGKRNITVEQILRLCDHFQLNANYMFGTDEEMFRTGNAASDDFSAPRIERAPAEKLNISLVPVKALAGYAVGHGDPNFMEALQKFRLPGLEGELTAFEISGDSMLPNLANGDLIVCETVGDGEPLSENAMYVIVTDVVVAKRIQLIKRGNRTVQLRLISDNDSVYRPYTVDAEEIRQILRVKCRLTSFGIA